MDYQRVLIPYNPWWDGHEAEDFSKLPTFQRPIFSTLSEDLKQLPQMLSIIGPRRIGKSTLLRQLIRKLLEEGVDRRRIIYYSFDDPALMTPEIKVEELIDRIMKEATHNKQKGPLYLFLDEIQKLAWWELYLKKYYDLKYPVKIVISGSASSPIFKKSRESLLGRVKDYHLLPFSFLEYVLFHIQDEPEFLAKVHDLSLKGKTIQGMILGDPHVAVQKIGLAPPEPELCEKMTMLLNQYFLEGGFPETWQLPTWVAKQDYLYDNQVKKVIYEDLVLAAEFRKPELLKRFYISLLEIPGREINIQTIAKETNVKAAQIDKYLPLLEMTDLVYRISKFRSSAIRVRKGMMKFYLVDLALRNAVLRLTETLLKDEATLGLYAENLVFLALRKWRGAIQMDYYRERHGEVDFIVHTGPRRFLPVEVKYRGQISARSCDGIAKFIQHHPKSVQPLIVTKQWSDFGNRDNVYHIPLPLFLVLFD